MPDASKSTADKFGLIMSFLENDDKKTPQESPRTVDPPSPQKESFREKMLALELERDEQAKNLETVKYLRQKERYEQDQRLKAAETQGSEQAENIKAAMALRLEKQMSMIEDLLEDKKQLGAKIETMVEQQHQVEKNRRGDEGRFALELKKNKDAWEASEKVRREKWEKDKTAEVRAQTVKGLEPEIQKIVQRNKEELKKAHDMYQRDIRDRRDNNADEYEKKVQEVKARL